MEQTTKKETSFHAGKQTNEVSNTEKEQTFSQTVYHTDTSLSSKCREKISFAFEILKEIWQPISLFAFLLTIFTLCFLACGGIILLLRLLLGALSGGVI